MGKKIVCSKTKQVVPEPFNSLLPGPRYKTENTHKDGSKVTGYGKSKSESRRDANRKSNSSGGCFLTSACVEARGLPDDCQQLQVLRNFRDGYVWSLPEGEELLATYYRVAPEVVAAISRSGAAKQEYAQVFAEIEDAVDRILIGDHEGALAAYKTMFCRLSSTYLGHN